MEISTREYFFRQLKQHPYGCFDNTPQNNQIVAESYWRGKYEQDFAPQQSLFSLPIRQIFSLFRMASGHCCILGVVFISTFISRRMLPRNPRPHPWSPFRGVKLWLNCVGRGWLAWSAMCAQFGLLLHPTSLSKEERNGRPRKLIPKSNSLIVPKSHGWLCRALYAENGIWFGKLGCHKKSPERKW